MNTGRRTQSNKHTTLLEAPEPSRNGSAPVSVSGDQNGHSRVTKLPDVAELPLISDPVLSARVAGLRYVNDAVPGIRRRRAGRGFIYIDPSGRRVTDDAVLSRIRRLAVPPAWTDVWICPDPEGHLQASGRDARRRKQYRYHSEWREVRDETKFGRMVSFGRALPRLRRRIESDLRKPGLNREKVLATVVRLLEITLIRVGNEEYARQNDSFGLTTMRDRHVDVSGSTLRFEFRGKSGIRHAVDLTDRRIARIVKACRDLPGYELFQYVDETGNRNTIDSADVNQYLRETMGFDFTAKDFRTWAGTVIAAEALSGLEPCRSVKQARKNVVQVLTGVASRLGNTVAICRKSYVHPAVIESYLDPEGRPIVIPPAKSRRAPRWALSPGEKAVLAFLEDHLHAAARKAAGVTISQVRAGVPPAWRMARRPIVAALLGRRRPLRGVPSRKI